MSKIEVNQISSQCGSTLTIGQSGDTVTLACGATAAGFGSTGEVSWNTTKITADPSNAVSGVGYFADTTSAAFTITLPTSPSAGNVVAISDYAGTFATNALTVGRNGSNINGSASDFVLGQNNITAQFIYVDATQGWRVVFTGSQTGEGLTEKYLIATGGTETTCGDYKIHTFTGPGSFTVSSVADNPSNNFVDYLVVAGAGSGGGGDSCTGRGGAGGAGGFRESCGGASGCYTTSPLANPCGALPVSASAYPITIGGGGTAAGIGAFPSKGTSGSNSVFSTITSAGGGGGGSGPSAVPNEKTGFSGGSGGGGATYGGPGCGGAGNTPPVSPPQGNAGGNGLEAAPNYGSGGGGGATAAGTNGTSTCGGPGGAGAGTLINPATGESGPSCLQYYSGGGGGSILTNNPGAIGTGGIGGGGNGGHDNCNTGAPPARLPGVSGTANTGGGGGGGTNNNPGGSGGSGIVIIRYKYQ